MSFRRGRNEGNTFLKNLPFGLAYNDVSGSKNTEFPVIPLPVNNPVTKQERIIAVTYINQTEAIKDGPFYLGDVDNSNTSTTNDDHIERYSDRYLKKRKIGISIDDHPYHLELFPKELYNVMGINKKKLVKIRKLNNNTNNIFTGENDESLGLSVLEKLKQLAENVDDDDEEGANGEENANRRADGEISDNDYDEDEEEDDDNDYNAEKYFDDGDDDGYGDDDDNGDEPAF